MNSRDLAYLEDMRINAEHAHSFVTGKSFEDFKSNVLLNYAVVRCLTIIGEAAKSDLPPLIAVLTPYLARHP